MRNEDTGSHDYRNTTIHEEGWTFGRKLTNGDESLNGNSSRKPVQDGKNPWRDPLSTYCCRHMPPYNEFPTSVVTIRPITLQVWRILFSPGSGAPGLPSAAQKEPRGMKKGRREKEVHGLNFRTHGDHAGAGLSVPRPSKKS